MPPTPRRDVSAYSRLVRRLKIGLPLLALALLSAIFLLPGRDDLDLGLIYSSADLIQLGEGLSVSNPRIEGSTAQGEPFVVEAERATPDGPDPKLVELDAVRAAFTQAEGRRITVAAAHGSLRPKDQLLALDGAVTMTTSDGYEVTTDRIEANLKAGEASAPGPVSARGPAGSIESGSFRARRVEAGEPGSDTLGDAEPGDYLWFENGVRVTWTPAAAGE
ncbi:LPS export ABC transporter periplasmic protein LptC [Albimonas sp. CAU 1670]|uniref:LPS export ABC transporter periplasmic protein LptC n=1 Tax=Albimonas sp. CAU 1670 TaxID=3032599 RepID=UPI0023DC3DB5|nr:LPS export ABC transporter periplasmic protein LptC [Albimonas sp. CAU 1670]MDF2233437.1 LPS export ABC transporter periplasmic protein LptC [Albimonas sp. CAU 1670]